MIVLKQAATEFDGINASPFCAKLELFMHYYQVPFTKKHALPFHGPYKKMPYIEFQGETLGDSELIIQRLISEYAIETGLDERQVSQGRAWQRLLEDHLYWVMVYCRWMVGSSWERFEPIIFGSLKWPLRPMISRRSRAQVKKDLYSQGIGRFTLDEILLEGQKDIQALNAHLTYHLFICGEKLGYFDLFAYAIIKNIDSQDMPTQLTEVVRQYPQLSDYISRVESELLLTSHP
ncbi:glutathione S-transferase family protein [Vibrio sp. F74]|uniref:glutathione S-transferase family protein n=1 Tax=Vibrio sp. F74 TaxID=700020 RepID=UPI0035F54F96